MCTSSICLLVLLICGPVALLPLSPKKKKDSLEDRSAPAALSEAIQKLQKVFDFEELPHNILPAKKPPQFMLELYSRVADADGSTKAHGLLQGNVVRSFENKVHSESGEPIFFFNISSVGNNEKMLNAELRVFKRKPLRIASRHHFCKVDVYEVLDSSTRPWRGNLISSRLLPLHYQGWEMFNVTQTVSKWVGDNKTNHGFLILSTFPSGNILDTDLLSLAKHQPDSKKSYLVLFSDDGRRGVPSSLTSLPNTKEADFYTLSSEPSSPVFLPISPNIPEVLDLSKSRKIRDVFIEKDPPCQRKSLYVDFEDIGWAGWIISPRGYNAYHCKGSCLFPLGQGLGATNHATVQSIVHALKLNKDIETPCCVPDQLNSINLLYFDDEENVVLKQYNDMVAVSCGCH
ncbi:hypothetical protein GDO86_013037 [Hymenochirus boettgeri]|uniref:TGF-beta family profile domain-containing protein n=1 Tax=Hymenochirus boettgeri TaxID=247094 RepID=A0A8T2IXQ7_9PIPI|nr:hypothetical protein GDO86_013037 [Hymenochirus boettgeri]